MEGDSLPAGPLSENINTYIYFFWVALQSGATGPCQGEMTSFWWRLSPWQGSRVTGGGGEAKERQSGKETGSLKCFTPGSVWAPLADSQSVRAGGVPSNQKPPARFFSTDKGLFYFFLLCGRIIETEQRTNSMEVIRKERKRKKERIQKRKQRKKKGKEEQTDGQTQRKKVPALSK